MLKEVFEQKGHGYNLQQPSCNLQTGCTSIMCECGYAFVTLAPQVPFHCVEEGFGCFACCRCAITLELKCRAVLARWKLSSEHSTYLRQVCAQVFGQLLAHRKFCVFIGTLAAWRGLPGFKRAV